MGNVISDEAESRVPNDDEKVASTRFPEGCGLAPGGADIAKRLSGRDSVSQTQAELHHILHR